MGVNILSEYFQNIYNGIKTLLSGMSITMHHFRNKKDLVATLQYPNEKWPIPDRNIGFDHKDYNVIRSRLHVDIDDCIGCLMCERACPVDCIKIDTIKPPKDSEFDCGTTSHDTQKKMIVPRFSIDMSECMYCNLCEYPCPEECIYMVGGPNEPKHEIDYEFSKYVKHDLVFEFANATDQEIIDIGGESYLEKRKVTQEKISNANELKGIVKDDSGDENVLDKKEITKHVEPAFVLFDNVTDKMSRGIAKKAFTYGQRNNKDMNEIADLITKAINEYNKMSTEMEESIANIKKFVNPKDSITNSDESNIVDANNIEATNKDEALIGLFDIKALNDIQDKMIRGSLKKIYIAGKRVNNSGNKIIDQMLEYLNENSINNKDIITLLNNLKTKANEENNEQGNNNQSTISEDLVLFDIKKLNDIEDKMVRGIAKKAYMAGKRTRQTSEEVISSIKSTLNELDKMNKELEDLLDGLI